MATTEQSRDLDEIARSIEQACDPGELTDLLRQMIKIPSHRGYPDEEREVAEFVFSFLEKAGLTPRLEVVRDRRPNVVCELEGEGTGPALLLNGHLDTIPPYDMGADAYSGRIDGDRIFGRGAADMKAGVAAMAYSLALLTRRGLRPKGKVVFAGVVGEEYEGSGTRYFVSQHGRIDMAIIGEPTKLQIGVAHKGIEWMEVVFSGRSVHSSRPEEGVNAIYAAAEFVQAVRTRLQPRLDAKAHPLLGPSLVNIGVIHGGVQPNVVPAECRVQVERRWNPGESLDGLYDEVTEIAQDVGSRLHAGVQVVRTPYSRECERPPLDTPADHPLVRGIRRSQVAWKRPEGRPVGLGMCTDGPTLARAGIPTVVFGPGDARNAHSATEHVEIDDVVWAAKIYALTPFALAAR